MVVAGEPDVDRMTPATTATTIETLGPRHLMTINLWYKNGPKVVREYK